MALAAVGRPFCRGVRYIQHAMRRRSCIDALRRHCRAVVYWLADETFDKPVASQYDQPVALVFMADTISGVPFSADGGMSPP